MPLRTIFMLLMSTGLALSQMGCNSNCKAACKQLVTECDAGPVGWTQAQCEFECESAQSLLDDDDTAADQADAFQDQLNCIAKAECSALSDPADPGYPACYDDEVQIYNTPLP